MRVVERGLTFTFTSDLSCIASILFANVNFTQLRTKKLRNTGNQPYVWKQVNVLKNVYGEEKK